MKRIIRLTESDLTRIVKKVLIESEDSVELQLNNLDNNDKIIKSDVKREKNEKAIMRSNMSAEERKKRVEDIVRRVWNSHLEYLKERGLPPPKPSVEKKELELLYHDYGQSEGWHEWKDLVYGYKKNIDPSTKTEITQKIVAATPDESGFPVGNKVSYIMYICPSQEGNQGGDYMEYFNMIGEQSAKQQTMDKLWLKPYCDLINWKSRVGKKRNIFRNPEKINDYKRF